MAWRVRGGALSRRATDADLGDGKCLPPGALDQIVGAIREALARHVVRCDRTARSYERAEKLAARLLDA
jgi:hypothetical protein